MHGSISIYPPPVNLQMPVYVGLLALLLGGFGALVYNSSKAMPDKRAFLEDSEVPGTPYQRV